MKTEELTTAKELLDFFNPSNEKWLSGKFLFRAQYEPDEHGRKLISNIFRRENSDKLLEKRMEEIRIFISTQSKAGMATYGAIQGHADHLGSILCAAAEKIILREFVGRTNRLGMPIPEAEQMLNWEFSDLDLLMDPDVHDAIRFSNEQPQGNLKLYEKLASSRPPLFAGLAQHHGCPTRLLDFSYNPYKALFHASNRGQAENGFIALYYIPETTFSKQNILKNTELKEAEKCTSVFQLVRMPASHNHYLFQQEGLFAYPVTPFHHFLTKGEYPSINSFAEMIAGDYPQANPLKRVIIPITELNELRKLLKAFNISLSSMMPSLDNVVKEMRS